MDPSPVLKDRAPDGAFLPVIKRSEHPIKRFTGCRQLPGSVVDTSEDSLHRKLCPGPCAGLRSSITRWRVARRRQGFSNLSFFISLLCELRLIRKLAYSFFRSGITYQQYVEKSVRSALSKSFALCML
jgi:hypothetical protein